ASSAGPRISASTPRVYAGTAGSRPFVNVADRRPEEFDKGVMEFGIRQHDDLVAGLEFGVAPHRYQAGGAHHDAHPDAPGPVTEPLDRAALGGRPRRDAQAMDPLGLVLEPHAYLPRLRL